MLKLTQQKGIRVGALGVALSLAGLAAGFFLLAGSGSSAPPLTLEGVDFAGLQEQGIRLEAPPDGTQAKIPEDDAAKKAGFPLAVKQVVLGRLITDLPPVMDRVVWIVSYDKGMPVSGGPGGTADESADDTSARAKIDSANYMLAFVDAETGEFIFSVQENPLKQ
jgi:hypothetical protein